MQYCLITIKLCSDRSKLYGTYYFNTVFHVKMDIVLNTKVIYHWVAGWTVHSTVVKGLRTIGLSIIMVHENLKMNHKTGKNGRSRNAYYINVR